jgi:hypothetical protein
LQARIVALCLEQLILKAIDSQVSNDELENIFSQVFEPICDKIQE